MKKEQVNIEGLNKAAWNLVHFIEERDGFKMDVDKVKVDLFDSKSLEISIWFKRDGYVTSTGRSTFMVLHIFKGTTRKNIPEDFFLTDEFISLFDKITYVEESYAKKLTDSMLDLYSHIQNSFNYLQDEYDVKFEWIDLINNSRTGLKGNEYVGPKTFANMGAIVIPNSDVVDWKAGACGGLIAETDNGYIHVNRSKDVVIYPAYIEDGKLSRVNDWKEIEASAIKFDTEEVINTIMSIKDYAKAAEATI